MKKTSFCSLRLIKSVFLFGCALFIQSNVYAQNSFPSSGSVGLGTGTLPANTETAIQFLHSSYELGYGSKIYAATDGPGATSLRIAVRGNTTTWTDAFCIRAADGNGKNNGSVGIGTTDTKGYKLGVKGSIGAESVTVKLYANWPDFVFAKTYGLRPLSEVESYIKANSHLPEVPSAAQVAKDGINLGEMDATLLKKIEELTLYLIEQNKQLLELKKQLQEVKQENESIKNQIQK